MFYKMFSIISAGCIISTVLGLQIEDLSLEEYSFNNKLNFDNIDRDTYLNEMTTTNSTFEAAGWSIFNMRLLDSTLLEGQLEKNTSIGLSPNDTRQFVEPNYYSVPGMEWGKVTRKIHLLESCRLNIKFSILLHNYQANENVSEFVLRNSPEMRIALFSTVENTSQEIVNLEKLNHPPNHQWKTYKLSQEFNLSDHLEIEFLFHRPKMESHILVRDLEVGFTPLVVPGLERLPTTTTTTTTTTTSTPSSTATTSTAEVPTNSTVEAPVSNSTTESTVASSTSETSTIGPIVTTTSKDNETQSTSSPSTTSSPGESSSTSSTWSSTESSTGKPTNESSPSSAEVGAIEKNGQVGYSGEVALIFFVVFFGLAFIVVVIKYVHLQKSIGANYSYNMRPTNT